LAKGFSADFSPGNGIENVEVDRGSWIVDRESMGFSAQFSTSRGNVFHAIINQREGTALCRQAWVLPTHYIEWDSI